MIEVISSNKISKKRKRLGGRLELSLEEPHLMVKLRKITSQTYEEKSSRVREKPEDFCCPANKGIEVVSKRSG